MQLQELYDNQQDILASDQNLFTMPIKQQTKKKTTQLYQLVKDTKLLIQRSKKDAIQIMKDSHNLHHYFPTMPPLDVLRPDFPPPEPDP